MNKKRFIWLIPILVMALAMSGCGDSNDDSDKGIGENLNWSDEQVYNADPDQSLYTGGNKPLTVLGGSGAITGGKFTFSIGAPNDLDPLNTVFLEMDQQHGLNIFNNAGFDPGNTRGKELVFANLSRKFEKTTGASTTKEEIYYIYVDKDCNVTTKGIDIPSIDYPYDEHTTVPVKVQSFTFKLTQGWNRVAKILSATATGGNIIIGPADKKDLENCKWILE